MYHVVLISENRELLKTVYDMMEDDSLLLIHPVPYSMDALSIFCQTHADIVILDTSVLIPFDNLLKQFSQCSWNYHVILLTSLSAGRHFEEADAVLHLENLSRELLGEVLDQIMQNKEIPARESLPVTLSWNGEHSFLIEPDAYHILLFRYSSLDDFHRFTEKTSGDVSIFRTGKSHRILETDGYAVCYLKCSELDDDFHFDQFQEALFQETNCRIGLLYLRNISWKEFQQGCETLMHHRADCFFLCGMARCRDDITYNYASFHKDPVRVQCRQIFHALLRQETEAAAHLLQEFYIHTLKPSFHIDLLAYVRLQLLFFSELFEAEIDLSSFSFLEEELEYLLQGCLFDAPVRCAKGISETLIRAADYIYANFHTEISLFEVAQELGLNKTYLNRIFKDYFGITIPAILQRLRLLHAKYYLTFTDETVSGIALQTGFRDIAYFTKCFKKETGFTASEYRLKTKGALTE